MSCILLDRAVWKWPPLIFGTWFFKFYLFIYLWLCWVFVSVRGLSLVAASGDHSSSWCTGLSLSQALLLWSTGSRRAGSVVVAHGPSCSTACGIFPDQGSNPCALHWQADSQPLRHQGSPGTWLYATRGQERRSHMGRGAEWGARARTWCSKNLCASSYVTQWVTARFKRVSERAYSYLLCKEFKPYMAKTWDLPSLVTKVWRNWAGSMGSASQRCAKVFPEGWTISDALELGAYLWG